MKTTEKPWATPAQMRAIQKSLDRCTKLLGEVIELDARLKEKRRRQALSHEKAD